MLERGISVTTRAARLHTDADGDGRSDAACIRTTVCDRDDLQNGKWPNE